MNDPNMSDSWILGLNFFKDYYVQFDIKGKRVGVYKSKDFGLHDTSAAITAYSRDNNNHAAFSDNSQDRSLTDNLKYCRSTEIKYNQQTHKCEDGQLHDFDKLQEMYSNIILI